MAELDDRIKNLLSSPDGINQIISSIRELSGETAKDAGQESKPETAEPAAQASSIVPQSSLSQASDLGVAPAAGSIPNLSALSKIDPKYLSVAMKVLNEYAYDDDKIMLLNALKPHLRSERRQRIDRASQMLRMAKSIKAALNSLSGGDTLV
ncbi:MAG: hypothetical protein ACOX1Q_01440 [Eubacteriales bacterium]|jgi:hypothetical protein